MAEKWFVQCGSYLPRLGPIPEGTTIVFTEGKVFTNKMNTYQTICNIIYNLVVNKHIINFINKAFRYILDFLTIKHKEDFFFF